MVVHMTSDSADASGSTLINLNDIPNTIEEKTIICYKRKSSLRLSRKQRKKNEQPAEQPFLQYMRRFRCGICKNCKAENCGECKFCLDMRVYGGRALLRKPCVYRVCLNKQRTPNKLNRYTHRRRAKQRTPIKSQRLTYIRRAAEKEGMAKVQEKLLINEANEKKCTVKLRDILAPDVLSKVQVKEKLESEDTTEKKHESNPDDSPVWRSNRKRASSTTTGPTSDIVSGQISKRMKKSNLDDLDLKSLIKEIEIINENDKKVFEREKQERCLSQKRLLRITLFKKSLRITNSLLKEQTAKTKKKRLKPYEYLKYATVTASEDLCDLSPPMLELQDKNCQNSGVEDSRPPVLQTYHEKIDKVKLSFSGRFCKPNSAYSKEEFVTNLKDLNALKRQMCKRASQKKKPVKVSDTPVEIERVDDAIKQEQEEFSPNLADQETVSTEDRKDQHSPVIRSILKSKVMERRKPEKRKQVKPTTERIVDSVYENLSQKASFLNVPRIPVQQTLIKQTVNQLAKEKKFVKFFQLDVGEKIIFIPTDGAAVIPKAYVMDKAIGKPEGQIDYTSSFIRSMGNTASTSSTKQESVDDMQEESLPKITSVFSLSSDCDTSSTDINENQSSIKVDENQSSVKVEPESLTSANFSNHENSAFQSAKSTSILGETGALDTDKRFSFRNVNSDLERERSLQNLVRETMTKLIQQGNVAKPELEENQCLQIKTENDDHKETQQSLITTDVKQQEEFQNTSIDVKQNINITTSDKDLLDENKTDLQIANLTSKTLCIPKVSFQSTDVVIKNAEATPVSVYSCGGKPSTPSADIMNLGNLEPLEKMKSKVFTATPQSTITLADSELKHSAYPSIIKTEAETKRQHKVHPSIIKTETETKRQHNVRPSIIKTETETKRQPVIAPKTIKIIRPHGSDPQHLFFIPISTASSEIKPAQQMYSLLMNKEVQQPVATSAAPLYSLVIQNPTTQSNTTTPTALAPGYQKISTTTSTVLTQNCQKIATYTGQPKILITKGQPPISILQTQLPTLLTKASTIKSQSSSENIPSSEPTTVLNKQIEAKKKCKDMQKVNEQTSNEMKTEPISQEMKTSADANKPSSQSYVETDQNLIIQGEKESKLRTILTSDEILQQTTVIKPELNVTPDRNEQTKHWENPFHSSVVKSEPDETGEYEILTFPNIKKENIDSETESENETISSETPVKSKTRRRKQLLEENFTHVHAEETDTEERIRRLREKLREQELKCAKLKTTLLSSDHID